MRPSALAVALIVVAACAPASPPPPAVAWVPAPPPPAAAPLDAGALDDGDAAARQKVHAMLVRVSRARGLPIRREVTSRVLDRDHILDRIRMHVEEEVPRDAVENEGELLAALELVPADYDFVEGAYKLIQGRIAGFYEPTDHTMYMVSDLDKEEALETLAHELDHALQDQSFPLAPIIAYAPGDGDRSAAAHTIIEGDAMSAMLDVVAGSAFRVSEQALRKLIAASNASSDVAATTPHVLQASLAAPYTDGFAFVQGRRAAGGWAAVDDALRSLPASTEQVLHPDKYASREAPIPVAVPTLKALGPRFTAILDDVVGEQSLRLMLEEWVPEAEAARGAAGWGGDRYVIARRDEPDARTIAVGWRAVMDTERDAKELASTLEKRFGKRCHERAVLGPITWQRRGRDLAVAAGPYQREGKRTKQAGTCATTSAWLAEILR